MSPVSAKELALRLPTRVWRYLTWRPGTRQPLRSRLAAVRVRAAHRECDRAQPRAEEWLLIEWPCAEPSQYWFSTLPAADKLAELVHLAKHRWIIERHYEELKQEPGLGHYEGRGWRGVHYHAALCIAPYGFLVAEANSHRVAAAFSHQPNPQIPDVCLHWCTETHESTNEVSSRAWILPFRHLLMVPKIMVP